MDGPKSMNESPTDAASLFDPLWKRKWLILVVAILVAAATYEYYKRETPTYSASTQLYLGGTSEQQANGSSKSGLSARALQNQVGVLNSPLISEVVKKRLHAEHNRLRRAASPRSRRAPAPTSSRSPRPRTARARPPTSPTRSPGCTSPASARTTCATSKPRSTTIASS
jgi:uncharacterized protein involved in exopolysaccharide biosynthesis